MITNVIPDCKRVCENLTVENHEESTDATAIVRAASRITILTGAGISTDSGIPDFRGPNGHWTRNPAAERTSHIDSYLGDPEVRRLSWRQRLESPAWTAEPNSGHRALLEVERQGRLVSLLTQNVDGLHQRVGHDPSLVVELHGTIRRVLCWTCGDEGPMETALARVRAGDPDPACLRCGGVLKSATVSFGEPLDPRVLATAQQAARSCDLLLVIGTTLAVHPAAGLVSLAHQAGAQVVIVNAQPTPYDPIAAAVVRVPISDAIVCLVALS
jgi:NAD-dependent deacetylase